MDLTKIVLEQVECADFDEFASYWHKDQRDYWPIIMYARITSPLAYERYEDAVRDFFTHPEANQLAVNIGGPWAKVNVRFFNKRDLEKVVEEYSATAREDKYKQNFFEMKFGYGIDSRELLIISFAEVDKKIIGHDVRLPMTLSHYVTIKLKEPAEMAEMRQKEPRVCELIEQMRGKDISDYRWAHGIWVPEGDYGKGNT